MAGRISYSTDVNKAVFYFQLKFWATAALLLFLYGLSYGHWEIALLRNLYLPVIGFALSTCMVPLYSRVELVWDYRSVVTVALVCSVAALVTALVVNPITFALLGEEITTLPRTEFLTDMLYFALFFVVWTLLYLYLFRERQSPAPRPSLIVESKGEILRLDLDDLECVKASDDYVELFTDGQSYLKKETLAKLEQQLPSESFMRIHRGVIINTRQVVSVRPQPRGVYEITMRSGLTVNSSRTYREDIATILPDA